MHLLSKHFPILIKYSLITSLLKNENQKSTSKYNTIPQNICLNQCQKSWSPLISNTPSLTIIPLKIDLDTHRPPIC